MSRNTAFKIKTTTRYQRNLGLPEKVAKKKFHDKAFGVLKNAFSGKSSVQYVASLRKEWRG